MPSKFKSPYGTTFTTGVKNGTPCSTVVWNISKKTNKPVNTIWNSLYKAGLCWRTKFNGTWLYWPSFTFNYKKCSSTNRNTTHTNMWQCFVDWCMCNGYCTPTQFKNNSSSQKSFMNFCRSFFSKQYTWSTSTSSKRTTKRTPKTKTYSSTSTNWTRNYKFPTFKTRTSTNMRRYRKAA
jgi:hypothetical protein